MIHHIANITEYKRLVPHHALFVQVTSPRPCAVRITHDDGRRLVRRWKAENADVTLETDRDGYALLHAHRPQPFRDEPPAQAARLSALREGLRR